MEQGLCLGIDPKSYMEFTRSLQQLDALLDDEFYLEAVLDTNPRKGFTNAVKNATHQSVKRTNDTIGTVVKGTETLGKVYGTGWDLMWKIFDLAVDAANFIVSNIGKMIGAVINGAKFVLHLPKAAYNRIKGNLELYVPVQAIDDFYGKQVCQKIHTFLQTMELFSLGDTWGKFVRIMTTRDTQGNVVKEQTVPGGKDMDLAKRMKKLFIELRYIDFKLDTIDMSNETNKRIYLSNEKSVKFVDTTGQEHHLSYFEALKFLLEDLQGCQKQLSELQKKVGDKHKRAQGAGQWATLSKGQQNLITEVITQFSQLNSMIGKMTKYIYKDIQQVNHALNTLRTEYPETDSAEANMQQAAYRQKASRSLPGDFSYKEWKGIPDGEKEAFRHLNDQWINLTQDVVKESRNKVDSVTVYLFVTSDENVKLCVFGFPEEWSLGHGKGPIGFKEMDLDKGKLPPSLLKELKPNEKIYIDC